MELDGEVLLEAPRDRVWSALNDAEVLRRCIPGCESMAESGDREKTATVAVKVGPVRARFTGRVRMEDIHAGESCTLNFEGQGGAAGMARGYSRVVLSDEAGGTRLHYQTHASVAGKLGQVGGRMIDAAARQMADRFFTAFQVEVAPAAEPAQTDAPAGPSAIEAKPEVLARAATRPLTPESQRPPPPPTTSPTREASRVLWFVLGALSTGLGVSLGWALFS